MSGDVAPITPGYEARGVTSFYQQHGATYRNPHEVEVRETLAMAVQHWSLDLSDVVDLACGSGEVTLELRRLGAVRIVGIDPYTGAAYRQRTGLAAVALTFADIAGGALEGSAHSLVVCSYAMHLCEQSRLAALSLALARVAPTMLIISPHKRPVIRDGWGWSPPDEIIHERVHARYYTAALPERATRTGA